jgi:polyhydroxybutyrate depolymerase
MMVIPPGTVQLPTGNAGRCARMLGPMAAVVLLLSLAACGGSKAPSGAPAAPAVQHRTIDVGGTTRSYRLYTPPSLDRGRAAPLVMVLGGVGNSAEDMVGATEFDRVAETGTFVVAYPDGLHQTWNAGYCCLGRATGGPDDVAFLTRLIDDVGTGQKLDQARIYAVGVSAGAMMAYRLGCEMAGRIAAVGSVAGAMILDDCHPAKPVSVIEIHGTADGLVPYQGGETAGGATQESPPTPAVAQRWADLDHCPAPATDTAGVVTTASWTGCAEGSAVKLVTLDGGGHTWFADGLGPVSGAVDASRMIWAFFSGLPARG